MISFISDLASGLVNLIYPLTCEACGAKIGPEEKFKSLCDACLNKIKIINPAVPLRHNNIKVWAVCVYEGMAKDCIHFFKYNSRLSLAEPLGKLMAVFCNENRLAKGADLIMPVPLYKSKLRERGFNQSELLSEGLAERGKISSRCLIRVKPTQSQTGLSKTKRFTNLKGAFKIADNRAVHGKSILLIDDVFTTGSTVTEAAKTLLKAGAKSVNALVLARGI